MKEKKSKVKDFLTETNEQWGLTIGNFDGVHLGHQELISELKKVCKESSLKSLIVTFVPHPREIFSKANLKLITDYKKREDLLKHSGVDEIISIDFNRDFSTMSAREFVLDHLLHLKKVKYLQIGHDFRFGNNQEGDYAFIKNLLKEKRLDIQLSDISPLKKDEQVVSSTLIRKKIESGEIEKASEFLGRKFSLKGTIIKGDGNGRKLGFPTANFVIGDLQIHPLKGVYSSELTYKGKKYFSITNIGVKPTLSDQNKLNIETHIFDFDEDIYGESLEVELTRFIREEKKFNSVDELVIQIKEDIKAVLAKI